MATDDLDPAQSQRRANDQLRVALLALDEHIVALTAPTMELALIQKKRASEVAGLEEREPSDLLKKFVSQAGPGARIGASEPGQLNPDASAPFEHRPGEPLSIRTGQEQFAVPPLRRSEQPSGIGNFSQQEIADVEAEQYAVPQYGKFQPDVWLRMARKYAVKKAGEAETEPGEPNKWASVAEKASIGVEKIPEAIAAYQAGKSYLKPALDIGFGAAAMGRSLGYTPQGEGLLGASHILGLPNPLSVIGPWASPGAQQGMGTFVNAAEAAFGGTGIGMGEASNLRQALASQGWSNQRGGGAFGFTVGGQQENIAQSLEPLVKMGFNSPTSIEQLGSWTNTLRLGQTHPEELKKTLEQLPEAAKILHKTLEEATQGMEDFATKAVEGGTSMIHGGRAYSEIAKITGMNPDLIQQMNESQFGQAQAIRKHIMPWEISSLTGGQQAMNAYETLKTLEGMVPARDRQAKTTTNALGEKVEMTAEESKYAYIHGVLGGPTQEQAKLLNQTAKRAPYAEAVTQKAGKLGKEIVGWQEYNQEHSRAGQKSAQIGTQTAPIGQNIEQLKREISETHEDFWEKITGSNGGKKEELEAKLSEEEEKLSSLEGSRKSAVAETRGKTGLSAEDQAKVKQTLTGPQGLYERALQAELPTHELERIQKLKLAQQPGELEKAVAKLSEVNPEGENTKIELSGNAKYWFKLEFPNAKSPKEEMGAGGKSGASAAGQAKTPGETAQSEAARKRFEKVHRKELTAAEG